MTAYSAVLFIHVASAIGVFMSLAAEGAILFRLRSARSLAEAQFSVGAFQRLRTIAIPSFLGVLVGGLYLGSSYGAGTYWLPAALAATLLMMLLGALVTGRRTARLKKELTGDDTDVSAMLLKTRDNALVISYGLRLGLGIGIVFLMTTKPELALSIVALGTGCAVGLLVARAVRRIADRNHHASQSWGVSQPTAQRS